eukprot:5451004-Alexandrium_andersonii.AAC.1
MGLVQDRGGAAPGILGMGARSEVAKFRISGLQIASAFRTAGFYVGALTAVVLLRRAQGRKRSRFQVLRAASKCSGLQVLRTACKRSGVQGCTNANGSSRLAPMPASPVEEPVSYTHLTLPTICSV